jgi:hypothetical protein
VQPAAPSSQHPVLATVAQVPASQSQLMHTATQVSTCRGQEPCSGSMAAHRPCAPSHPRTMACADAFLVDCRTAGAVVCQIVPTAEQAVCNALLDHVCHSSAALHCVSHQALPLLLRTTCYPLSCSCCPPNGVQ